ncbi:MAG TPA: 50S ribosomal protein L11 [Candidatus Korarchaeota archaeon]|nr:MAG: 50S ribosomal protein L11 [Candidatus Korarchaeota archaeon]HDI86565.1 50S ribosomal protein L11 [Candidatus Korarchaeota archaeon]
MPKKVVKVLVEGGKATPGPPIGPALGGLGVDIGRIVGEINQKTKEYAGMKVPVEIIVDLETRQYEVRVGLPPTSMLLIREIGVEKGSGEAGSKSVGDLKREQIVKIAKMKLESMNTTSLKSAVKQVLGTAVSVGVTVEGKHPKEAIKDVDAGLWDDLLKEEGS